MKAYSQDLRERALRAVDDDYPRAEIVQMFGISLSTLKRYVKQRREEGHVRPKTIPGRPPKKRAQVEAGVLPQLPTGCATSFTSTAIRFESILHRFSFSRKRRCLNPCPWTSASVERACQGASIENTAALCILWARLIQADESLARTAGQVEAFCHMLRQRQGYRLRGWLEEVEQHGEPELQAFARNLHKEESAVQAGLTLAWSNGPTEGFIHRLKLLKRQAYGRAGVALLKQRMLFHPSNLIAA
jgi:transposase